jgi:hypothetical protein
MYHIAFCEIRTIGDYNIYVAVGSVQTYENALLANRVTNDVNPLFLGAQKTEKRGNDNLGIPRNTFIHDLTSK